MGSAIARVPDEDTPLGLREAAYNFHVLSMWADTVEPEKHMSWAREFAEAMQPWTTERTYLNFISDEAEERVRTAYDLEKYRWLVALKDEYDPDNLFCLNQNIKPSSNNGAAS